MLVEDKNQPRYTWVWRTSLGGLPTEVAEIFTGTPGAFVDLETTINDFEEVRLALARGGSHVEMAI